MLILIIAWSLFFAICFIVGSTVIDFFKSSAFNRMGDRFVISTWIGIVILSNALLFLSLFTKLSLLVLTIVSFALLLISFSIKKTNPFREIKSKFSVALVSGLFALLFSTSYVSTQVVTWYDTGGYHFGMVKWLSHCGAVPGLALLYYGFGYTSSWFALAAPFNEGILAARMSTLTGGFAFLLMILHFWICLVRIFSNRAKIQDWFLLIASLLALVVITRYEIHVSPSQDLPVIILIIVVAFTIIAIKKHKDQAVSKNSNAGLHDAVVPLILSAGALTFKLSALPIFLISVAYYLINNGKSFEKLIIGAGIITLILSSFLIVQIIASGCPLYPSSLMCIDLPWTIGDEKISAVSDQIKKAAQWSTITPPVGNSWAWLGRWLIVEKFQTVLIFLSVISFILLIKKWRQNHLQLILWPILIGLLGCCFAMIFGPTWRYTLGYLAVMNGISLSLYCENTYINNFINRINSNNKNYYKIMPALFLVLLSIAIPTLSVMRNNLKALNYLSLEINEAIKKGELTANIHGWEKLILPPRIINFQLSIKDVEKYSFVISDLEFIKKEINNFSYLKPIDGYQCWDAPLPCSQILTYENIRLRDKTGDICKGFIRE